MIRIRLGVHYRILTARDLQNSGGNLFVAAILDPDNFKHKSQSLSRGLLTLISPSGVAEGPPSHTPAFSDARPSAGVCVCVV